MNDWILLIAYVGGALVISFMCSLLEAVVMSSNPIKLEALASTGDRAAKRMLIVKKNSDDAIAAILSLNTVAHTVGATLAGAQAMDMFGDVWIGLFSAILTLLILVLTEIIPKNVGERYPERLAGMSSVVLLKVVVPIMKPVVIPIRWITSALYGEKKEEMTRPEVNATHDAAAAHGAIDDTERSRLGRIMQLRNVPLSELAITRLAWAAIPATMTLRELSQEGPHSRHTRVLVQGDTADDVAGYIYLEEAFRSVLLTKNEPETEVQAAKGLGEGDTTLIRSVSYFTPEVATGEVLHFMLREGVQIGVVLDEAGAVAGAVSLEEVLEYILDADIRDEDDPTKNLREVASELRAKRLAGLSTSGKLPLSDLSGEPKKPEENPG